MAGCATTGPPLMGLGDMFSVSVRQADSEFGMLAGAVQTGNQTREFHTQGTCLVKAAGDAHRDAHNAAAPAHRAALRGRARLKYRYSRAFVA